jgi:hypothetical protein
MAALPLIVFDVCEALLDLATMGPPSSTSLATKARWAWFAICDPLHRRHECVWLLRSIHDIGAAVMKMQADTTRLSYRYRTLKVLTDVDLETR